MAGTVYSVTLTTPIADIKNAMLTHYGAYDHSTNPTGINVLYETAEYLIFTCTAISDKYIRIRWTGSILQFRYGTGYSGTDVTNGIDFGGTYTSSSYQFAKINFILFSDMLFMCSESNAGRARRVVIIGKLSNSDYWVCGMCSDSDYMSGILGQNTTKNECWLPIGLATKFLSEDGKIMSQPLYLYSSDTDRLCADGSSNKIYANNILAVTWGIDDTTILTGDHFITCAKLLTRTTGDVIKTVTGATGLLVELQ